MLKTYYAYLAIAGGYLLYLIGGQLDHWPVFVAAFGLIALGALEVRRFSRWYFYAAGAALSNSILYIAAIWLSGWALVLLMIAALCALSVCLLLGMTAQRRAYGEGMALEYALLALLAVYGVGGIALLAPNTARWFALVVTAANTCLILFLIGMIFDVFRMQKLALANEDEQ